MKYKLHIFKADRKCARYKGGSNITVNNFDQNGHTARENGKIKKFFSSHDLQNVTDSETTKPNLKPAV